MGALRRRPGLDDAAEIGCHRYARDRSFGLGSVKARPSGHLEAIPNAQAVHDRGDRREMEAIPAVGGNGPAGRHCSMSIATWSRYCGLRPPGTPRPAASCGPALTADQARQASWFRSIQISICSPCVGSRPGPVSRSTANWLGATPRSADRRRHRRRGRQHRHGHPHRQRRLHHRSAHHRQRHRQRQRLTPPPRSGRRESAATPRIRR